MTIVREAGGGARAMEVEAALEEGGLDYTGTVAGEQRLGQFLTALPGDAVVFPSRRLATRAGFTAHRELSKLAETRRVLLAGGPLDVPYLQSAGTGCEVVTFDWHHVIGWIAQFLATDGEPPGAAGRRREGLRGFLGWGQDGVSYGHSMISWRVST